MTDKPTQKEMDDLFVEETGFYPDDFPAAIFGFARAVLEKWGQPAQAAEPVAWLRNTTDPQPHAVTNLKYRSAVDAKAGVEYIPVFAAPQPVALRPEFDHFLSDVMTAAGLVTHGKQCKQLGERLGAAVMKLCAHGIKGD